MKTAHQNRNRMMIISFVVLWLAFNLWALIRYPDINCDEAFYSRTSELYWNSLFSSTQWPAVGIMFYLPHGRTYWLLHSLETRLLGDSIFSIRLLSVLGWGMAGLAAYAIAVTWLKSRKIGIWATTLTMTSWLGLYTGHFARPDILAAAAGGAVLAGTQLALNSKRRWPLLLLGGANVMMLDIHLNLLHFAWPIVLITAWPLIRRRDFAALTVFFLGLASGAGLYLGLHLGRYLPDIARLLLNNPSAFSTSYVKTDTLVSPFYRFSSTAASFGRFWWEYYALRIRSVALPQAVFFLAGVILALFSHDRKPKTLALVLVASNLSFALINSRYQAYYYAVLWIPLYMVLGTYGLFWLADRTLKRTPELHEWGPKATLSLLLLLYIAGDFWLTVPRPSTEYANTGREILEHAQAGDRVLTSARWWYAFKDRDDIVLIDEHLLSIENSGLWWNAVPDEQNLDHDTLSLVRPDTVSTDEAVELVEARLQELQPDLIIDDERIGCVSSIIPLSVALTSTAQALCVQIDRVETAHYGSHTIYSCDW